MKMIQKTRRIIGLLVAIATLVSPSIQAYTPEYIDHVLNNHLSTFPAVEREAEKPVKSLSQASFADYYRALRAKRDLGLRKLTEREKKEIIYKQMPNQSFLPASVIDKTFVDKINLVQGEKNLTDHLAQRINTAPDGTSLLQTEVGKKRLIEMLAQPTSNMQELGKRQSIIRELVKNDTLRKECSALLKKMNAAEHLVLELYTKQGLDAQEKELNSTRLFQALRLSGPTALSTTTRIGQGFVGALATIGPLLLAVAADIAKDKEYGTAGGAAILGAYFTALVTIPMLGNLKLLRHVYLNMQERLIGMATYLNSLKQLMHALDGNAVVAPLLPELKQVSQQLQYDQNASKEFNQLNKLLQKRTFKEGPPSALFSPGNIMVAYRNVVQESVRREYAKAMNFLGELDVYVALANKIKAHQGLNAQFCFAEFIEKSDKPVIKATNFWNPFVDHKIVVGNDVALNTGQERDIILTGPNTGGKSTIMKGLMFSVLLAQTFGIAPAKSLSITPFTKLLTYLNISDDTGAGVSLFKAEVNQAKAIMETVRALKPNEFVFLITDEMFTGTSPDKGEELSFNFAKQLTTFPNCIFIQATHFKKLTELPALTKGICKNYYTGVIIEGGKVVKYTYKLVPGISPISTAEQIAKEEEIFDF